MLLAAVGTLMTEVAAEVADGLLVHPFTTERYLREVTLPAIERGLAASGRSREDFTISFSGLIATGSSDEQIGHAASRVRAQLAFYGSTPAYRGVLELHGWGELQQRLNERSRTGDWDAMGEMIDDDVLETFAVVARSSDVAPAVAERFGDVIDRFSIYAPYSLADDDRRAVVEGLRAL